MYLVDTNVWLERLLNQDKADDVRRFLELTSPRELYITDFNPWKTPSEILRDLGEKMPADEQA